MRRTARFLARLHAWSLHLYPHRYRLDYANELQAVFELMLAEVSTNGRMAVLGLGLREFRDMPGALLFQHLRERRNPRMDSELNNGLRSEVLTWKAAFTSLIPMLLTIVWWVVIFEFFKRVDPASALYQSMAARAIITISLFFLPIVAGVVWGLAIGTPRWTYLHIGLLISILGMLLVFAAQEATRLFDTPSGWTRWLYQVGPWASFTIITVLLILLARAWRPLGSIYQGLKGDWTLLSLALSTSIIWFLAAGLDEIQTRFLWPYLLVGVLILFAGVLFYLRSSSPSKRLFALLAAISLAMLVLGVGRSVYWGNSIYGEPRLVFSWATVWNEARATFRDWIALMLLVIAPAILGLLSRIREGSKPDQSFLSA